MERNWSASCSRLTQIIRGYHSQINLLKCRIHLNPAGSLLQFAFHMQFTVLAVYIPVVRSLYAPNAYKTTQ
jgi:hypothetical protein